jgi:lysine-N-methylase
MTLVDGVCLQRTSARQYELHERGGAGAKPIACATYPATFVDDGVELRASVALECSCVFESLAADGAEPLLDPSWTTASDLAPGIAVRTLPDRVALTSDVSADRAALSAWSRGFGELALAPAERAPVSGALVLTDGVTASLALAAGLREHGLAFGLAALGDASAPDRAPATARVAELATLFADAAKSATQWRSAADRTRRMREALAVVAGRLAESGPLTERALADSTWRDSEALALRAAIFGHGLAGIAPLADGLVDLAARFVVARALGRTELGHPLAVVMATTAGM